MKTSKPLHFKTFYFPLSLNRVYISCSNTRNQWFPGGFLWVWTCPHPLLEWKKPGHTRASETYLPIHWTEHEQVDKSGHGTTAVALDCPAELDELEQVLEN